ncbi:MAG: potassium channel protein [Chlorobi bacterium]|nr:potassium channel protein [Chlorobiota bacterium]
MRQNRLQITVSLSLLILILVIGVGGYMIIEHMTLANALYMTVITLSTVGYGEVKPLSVAGKFFTTGLIIFSLGILAYLISNLTRLIFENIIADTYKKRKVKRKIDKLRGHVILCGYGRNGKQAAKELADHKQDFVILEFDPLKLEDLGQAETFLYLEGDATQEEKLIEAGVERAKALITTLPNDADNLLVVITARQFNPELVIISRASEENSDIKLKRAGATNVIMSDRIGGQRMAKLVVQPDVVEFLENIMLQAASNVTIVELSCHSLAPDFVSKSIRELGVRNISGANIIGLKKKGKYILNPDPDVILDKEDQIFALGNPEQIKKFQGILTTGAMK